jgi:DnaK suppressor protein
MDATTLNEFKSLFTELYKDTINNINKETEEYFVEHLSGDQVDQSQASRDQMLNIRLKGRENFYLKKLETALERINNGTFGECEECGEQISVDRLRARPTACMCIHCKEDQERSENNTVYEKRSRTVGATLTSNVVPLISHDHQVEKQSKHKLWAVSDNVPMS